MENQIEGPHLEAPPKRIENPAAPQASGITFKLELSNDVGLLGYMGVDTSGWCILVTDISQAINLSQYLNNGVSYYMANGSYLSVSTRDYVGLYGGWHSACGWTFQGETFVSEYGQALSLSDGHLYAWDAYGPLIVKRV